MYENTLNLHFNIKFIQLMVWFEANVKLTEIESLASIK